MFKFLSCRVANGTNSGSFWYSSLPGFCLILRSCLPDCFRVLRTQVLEQVMMLPAMQLWMMQLFAKFYLLFALSRTLHLMMATVSLMTREKKR